MRRFRTLIMAGLAALMVLDSAGCLLSHQRFHHFSAPTPLPIRSTLVIGFMGGRTAWDDQREGVRRLALRLRDASLPLVVETVENQKRDLALRLVRQMLDQDQDGVLSLVEKEGARIILYGMSFGGAAVVKFARQLDREGIPVMLTVQVDSVGRGDGLIPPNVRSAANLYQDSGWFLRGEHPIRAEDPSRTTILENTRFHYRDRRIDLSAVPWHKEIFRKPHAKMDQDPEVWRRVAELITAALRP